ncbi:MAG: hypothetical protein D4R73_07050 [Deltaproteobacteria bacterium]|nr:MAG: hypothetical protein D4R73_07050 [Deltaproteobacteria bacterium]
MTKATDNKSGIESITFIGGDGREVKMSPVQFDEVVDRILGEKLICPKCNQDFPATFKDRGPGPAKAKFAAHVNKCQSHQKGGPMNTVKKNLLYQFTESELKKIGQEMAFTVGELETLEQEKKDAMAGFKDRMESLGTKIKDAAHKINTGQEQRLIDCEVRKDFTRNIVETFRLDTYGLVEERAMTVEERQQELEFQAAKAPAGGKVESSMLGATLGGDPEPLPLRAVGGKKAEYPELV